MNFPSAHGAVLRAASWLVPGPERAEWLAEWTAELWYALRRPPNGRTGAMAFCLGAFRDALWLRFHRRVKARRAWFESPLGCLLFLATLAAAGSFIAHRLSDSRETVLLTRDRLTHFLMLLAALAILPATTSLRWGEFSSTRHAPVGSAVRRWASLVIKIALLLVVAFCVSLSVLALLSAREIQPHGLLAGYVLALRWAIIDQRKRCPVYLRLLTHPAEIGQVSHTFLEWYGTEFLCRRGHGLLEVPQLHAVSCTTQRWIPLDQTWKGLFAWPEGARQRPADRR
jgi:hypothetical protein